MKGLGDLVVRAQRRFQEHPKQFGEDFREIWNFQKKIQAKFREMEPCFHLTDRNLETCNIGRAQTFFGRNTLYLLE